MNESVHRYCLKKSERLCSRTAVEMLFAQGQSSIAYPLRAVYRFRQADERSGGVQMMITIPKKKIKLAVNRVLLRRRIREAYRLHRGERLATALGAAPVALDVAFLYLATSIEPYRVIEAKVCDLLDRIARHAQESSSQP